MATRPGRVRFISSPDEGAPMLVSGTRGGEGERHVFWDVALSRNRRGVPELHLEKLATQSGEYIVMEHDMPRSDVLVIGAGPTGLILALWLTKLGVKLRIIDKTAEPGTTSRALAVHAR